MLPNSSQYTGGIIILCIKVEVSSVELQEVGWPSRCHFFLTNQNDLCGSVWF